MAGDISYYENYLSVILLLIFLGLDRACCGSSLILTNDLLQTAGTFTANSAPGISGEATGTFPAENAYPPGRVTDLKASKDTSSANYVANLTFTATGEDYNVGQGELIVKRIQICS